MDSFQNLFYFWILKFVSVIILGYLWRKLIEGRSYTKSTRIDGKIVIVTGGSAGIGKETVIELAKRGGKVYIACNHIEEAETVRDALNDSGYKQVFVEYLDLSSMQSVRDFVHRFKAKEKSLDILINNAGIYSYDKFVTKEGHELVFAINYLGHFLLTNLSMDLLKKSGDSRIINVSSALHRFAKIDKNNLQQEQSYSSSNAYAVSKLATVLFSRGLVKRLKTEGIYVFISDPRFAMTKMVHEFIPTYRVITKYLVGYPFFVLFAKSAKAGAQSTIFCALDPDISSKSGEYFTECAVTKMNPVAYDDELIDWLWNKSEELVELKKSKSP